MGHQTVTPYLFFGGRCEEAISFYRTAIGAQQEFLMRYSESPEPMPPGMLQPGFEQKVMHASFRIGNQVVMASDGCGPGAKFEGFSLALTYATPAEATRVFQALSAGGQVTMPLEKTFWSPLYGMLTDKFGIAWMVMVAQEPVPGA